MAGFVAAIEDIATGRRRAPVHPGELLH